MRSWPYCSKIIAKTKPPIQNESLMNDENRREVAETNETDEIPMAELWEDATTRRSENSPPTPLPETILAENDPEIIVAEVIAPANSRHQSYATSGIGGHQVNHSALAGNQIARSISSSSPLAFTPPPPLPEDLENVAAVGGAVAAVVLGIFSIFGAMITSFSILNAIIGIGLGCWGKSSPRRDLARIGIFLCVAAIVVAQFKLVGLDQAIFNWLGKK